MLSGGHFDTPAARRSTLMSYAFFLFLVQVLI